MAYCFALATIPIELILLNQGPVDDDIASARTSGVRHYAGFGCRRWPFHHNRTGPCSIMAILSAAQPSSLRAYSSSKRLIVRHKVIQQREQFCSPLDDLTFQVTFLDQFDLPVG